MFQVFMLISVYYVGVDIACYSTEEAEYCQTVSKFGIFIIIEILGNLVLFQYYSRYVYFPRKLYTMPFIQNAFTALHGFQAQLCISLAKTGMRSWYEQSCC